MLTFPLSLEAFFGALPVAEITFDAPPQVEMAQTGGGEQLVAETGPQLWTGSVRLGLMTRAEAATPDVLLDLLRRPGASFYACDTRRPAPLADPAGTFLGATVPTIASLGTDAREIKLTGLPAFYVLSRGDYLSWAYNSGRQALHRVVDAAVNASAGGITPAFEVTPPVRAGVTVATPVTLLRAACKAVIRPGTVAKGTSWQTVTEGMTFDFVQTLR